MLLPRLCDILSSCIFLLNSSDCRCRGREYLLLYKLSIFVLNTPVLQTKASLSHTLKPIDRKTHSSPSFSKPLLRLTEAIRFNSLRCAMGSGGVGTELLVWGPLDLRISSCAPNLDGVGPHLPRPRPCRAVLAP